MPTDDPGPGSGLVVLALHPQLGTAVDLGRGDPERGGGLAAGEGGLFAAGRRQPGLGQGGAGGAGVTAPRDEQDGQGGRA